MNGQKKIIQANKEKLESLANLLLEREVIFREDLEMIFGKRPFEKEEMVKPATENPSLTA